MKTYSKYNSTLFFVIFRVDKDRSGQITAIELASALSNGNVIHIRISKESVELKTKK